MNQPPDIEQIKARLAAEIVRLIGEHHLSDAAASKRLGIESVDIDRLRNVELDRFSIDRLISILNGLDQRVTVSVVPTPNAEPDTRPIWERIAGIVAGIPHEEWEKLPTDLAANHDKYLYGARPRD